MPPRKAAPKTGRHSTDSPREGSYNPPVRPSTAPHRGDRRDSRPKHYRDSPLDEPMPYVDPPPRKPRKASTGKAPKKAAAPQAPSGPSRHERVAGAARDYANRSAYRATNAKPSVLGRAAGGAAGGAAAGAAIGGPVGAGVGAAAGGVGGAVAGHSAKKAYIKAMNAGNGNARRIIVAEFAVCMVIVALSPLTKADERPGAWMKRMSAVMGVFLVLAFLSAGGRGVSRAAAGFGGIVTLTLAVSERDLFAKMASIFSSVSDKAAPGSRPVDATPSTATPPDNLGGGVRADREAQLRYGTT